MRIASRVDSACSVVPTLRGYSYPRSGSVLASSGADPRGSTSRHPDGCPRPGVVEMDGGSITHVGPTTGHVPDRVLVPGLVDLQVNGIDDVDVAAASGADWDALDAHLVAQGVTTWCPTLVTAPLDRYAGPLARIARPAARPGPRPAIAGAHLEGPFLGGRPGAHPRDLIIPPDRSLARRRWTTSSSWSRSPRSPRVRSMRSARSPNGVGS